MQYFMHWRLSNGSLEKLDWLILGLNMAYNLHTTKWGQMLVVTNEDDGGLQWSQFLSYFFFWLRRFVAPNGYFTYAYAI